MVKKEVEKVKTAAHTNFTKKNGIVRENIPYVASDIARSARGSAHAPIILSNSDWSITIDAFPLFDHCHNLEVW